MTRLAAQTLVVTGAASGIGAAIARGAAAEGADVIWLDRAPQVKAEAADWGGTALVADVTDPSLPERLLRLLNDRGGRLDHLVSAAGVQVRTRAIDIDEADWQRLLDTNLSGFYRMVRPLVPMLAEGSPGSVMAVGSMSADRATSGIVPYGAVKAALTQLVRGLAVELGPSGIRCNAIAPGYVATPMTSDLLARPENRARIMARLPLGRIATPEEMVGPALFLLSKDAGYVTGQVLGVDGGYTAT